MPRQRVRRLFPVAVSVQEAADVLGIRAEQVRAATVAGDLAVYQIGTKRRILIESLVAWAKTWKRVR